MSAQDWVIIIGAMATATVAIIGAVGAVLVQVRANGKLIKDHTDGAPHSLH